MALCFAPPPNLPISVSFSSQRLDKMFQIHNHNNYRDIGVGLLMMLGSFRLLVATVPSGLQFYSFMCDIMWLMDKCDDRGGQGLIVCQL